MDNQPAGSPRSSSLRLPGAYQIILYLICGLVGFNLGFFLRLAKPRVITKTFVPPQVSPTQVPDNLPISSELLKNPIVYQWRGSIKGRVTYKTDHSFTLTDDKGNIITITDIIPGGANFKTIIDETNGKDYKQIPLKDVPIGTLLQGDFFIFKDSNSTPVGGHFVIIH